VWSVRALSSSLGDVDHTGMYLDRTDLAARAISRERGINTVGNGAWSAPVL
jgi:hypothetical protein